MRTTPQYRCLRSDRLAALRAQSALNGIEFLEVATEDQLTLRVVFVHPLPGTGDPGAVPAGAPALRADQVRIEGGVRVRGIRVVSVAAAGRELTVVVSARGDFSAYTLRLVADDAPGAPSPAGFDPSSSAVEFGFKVACPADFDCREAERCPPPTFPEPALDYRAKDWESFRRLMLDRVAALLPGWRERSPADPLITLVEALAFEADRLSYWQDAIATEAYLGTARRRISLRRHARLLDYRVHDGCNARTFVHVEVAAAADGQTLPAGTLVLTRGEDETAVLPDDEALVLALREVPAPTVFRTQHDLRLAIAHNRIAFHTWGGRLCCLPRGATRATLRHDPALALAAGDWLLFEEIVGPSSGLPAEAEAAHRQVVRLVRAEPAVDPLDGTPVLEVEWTADDALTFPLCLSVRLPTAANDTVVSVARANLVLADHGQPLAAERLAFAPGPAGRPPRARLSEPAVTHAVPLDPRAFAREAELLALPPARRRGAPFLTARGALAIDPAQALPQVALDLDGETWRPRRDLLGSDRFAPDFVVETDDEGVSHLRFGDGVHGRRPREGAPALARYRVGNGRAGNLGAEALGRVRTDVPGVLAVRNPLPARGGTDPEDSERVRQAAPQAFRWQRRGVTAADWVEVARRHPEVQHAAAQFRWTGSWHTVFLVIDRRGGRPVAQDEEFRFDLRRHLERHRLAGYDLAIAPPVWVPLDIALWGCVKPGYLRSEVRRELQRMFSAVDPAGFFHPDRLTFGGAVHTSRIIAAAMAVPGVSRIVVQRFQRWGRLAAGELAAGVLRVAALEIPRCDSDPNFPENGRIDFELEGGL
jgi:hypothetical protein